MKIRVSNVNNPNWEEINVKSHIPAELEKLSELARNTYSKLSVYGCCIVLFIGIDKMVGSDTGITTSAICIGIVLVEAWSTCGSMIICYPDLPFLKLLKKALTGEIARKLNVPTDKVDEVLYNLNNRSNAKD